MIGTPLHTLITIAEALLMWIGGLAVIVTIVGVSRYRAMERARTELARALQDENDELADRLQREYPRIFQPPRPDQEEGW
jgi:hypothetical protein